MASISPKTDGKTDQESGNKAAAIALNLVRSWGQMNDENPEAGDTRSGSFFRDAVVAIEAGLMEETLEALEDLADHGEELDGEDLVVLRMDLGTVIGDLGWSNDAKGMGRVVLAGLPMGGDFHSIRSAARVREKDLLDLVRPYLGESESIELFSLGVLRAGEALDLSQDTNPLLALTKAWANGGEFLPEQINEWRQDAPPQTPGMGVPGGNVLVVAARLTGESPTQVMGVNEPDIEGDEDSEEAWMEAAAGAGFEELFFGIPAGLGKAAVEATAMHLEMNVSLARMSMDDSGEMSQPIRLEIQPNANGEEGFDLHAHFEDGARTTLESMLPDHLAALFGPIASHFSCSAAIDFGDGVWVEVDGEVDGAEQSSTPFARSVMVPGNRTVH